MTTAAAVQYSDEYKFDVSTDAYLKFVEQYGRVITEQDSVWTRLQAKARESYSLTNWLLALAVCLFLIDVTVRRFQYVPKREGRKNPVQEPHITQVSGTQKMEQTQTAKATESEKRQKRQRKPKQPEQTLDTSQLLKKKDDRKV